MAVDILNVRAGCGRFPAPAELRRQLEAAGFTTVRGRSMIPTDSYWVFVPTAHEPHRRLRAHR